MPSLAHRLFLFAALGAAAVRGQVPPATSATDPFEGIWAGTVTAPNDRADLGFAFQRGAHGLNASLSMPAMFLARMPLGPAEIRDQTYTLPDLGIRLALQGETLVGTFANPLLRVELHRSAQLPPALPVVAPPPAPAALWTLPLGAETWASPVARDGVLYVGCVDGRFHAIRAANGTDVWTWAGAHALFGDALVTAERIAFLDDDAGLVSLNRADGTLQWRISLRPESAAARAASPNPTFNRRVPVPLLVEDTLYIGSPDHGLYAIDAVTGAVRWRHDVGAPIFGSVAADGDRVVVAAFDGSVLVLSRATGAELLRTKLGGPIASAPVIAGDILLVGCRDYLLYGLHRSDLSVAWRDSYWFSWIESVPRVVEGLAYVGGSDYRRVSAIDPVTGQARWVTEVGGITWGSPVVTAHSVYAGTSAQNPAAIRHEGGLTALDRRTGAVKWRLVIPLPAKLERAGYLGSLVCVDGKIIGAGFDGKLSAYPAD